MIVKAVAPYIHPGFSNFKTAPYEAWVKMGGRTAPAHYPHRLLHGLAYRYELPSFWRKNKKEARLRFVEPVSITFDTFPDYMQYDIIPFVWDCWPCYFEKMCSWLKKHQVRTAIFTSSQTAERIRQRFPAMQVLFCPEAVDISKYCQGKALSERSIDLLEFGRSNDHVLKIMLPVGMNHVKTKGNGAFAFSNKQLYAAMGEAKVTVTLPRSMTQPEVAGNIETLTQRYWECMLSGMVMVGHAPKELTELIGYSPVVELAKQQANEQILDILSHIEDFQD